MHHLLPLLSESVSTMSISQCIDIIPSTLQYACQNIGRNLTSTTSPWASAQHTIISTEQYADSVVAVTIEDWTWPDAVTIPACGNLLIMREFWEPSDQVVYRTLVHSEDHLIVALKIIATTTESSQYLNRCFVNVQVFDHCVSTQFREKVGTIEHIEPMEHSFNTSYCTEESRAQGQLESCQLRPLFMHVENVANLEIAKVDRETPRMIKSFSSSASSSSSCKTQRRVATPSPIPSRSRSAPSVSVTRPSAAAAAAAYGNEEEAGSDDDFVEAGSYIVPMKRATATTQKAGSSNSIKAISSTGRKM
jgi:hypothetical protein